MLGAAHEPAELKLLEMQPLLLSCSQMDPGMRSSDGGPLRAVSFMADTVTGTVGYRAGPIPFAGSDLYIRMSAVACGGAISRYL